MCLITSVLSNKVLGLDLCLIHMEPIENTSRATKTVRGKDSVGKAICFAKNGSKSKDKEGPNASKEVGY